MQGSAGVLLGLRDGLPGLVSTVSPDVDQAGRGANNFCAVVMTVIILPLLISSYIPAVTGPLSGVSGPVEPQYRLGVISSR